MHILILEPDHLLAGSLETYFANANQSVSVHSDPQVAVTAADQRRPQAVIAELQLAGRSGVEFLYEFRSYPDWQEVPIIIFTSLQPDQIAGYKEVLADLNVAAILYKTQSRLADLLAAVRRSTPSHAQV